MADCGQSERLLELLMTGRDLRDADARLFRHAERCSDCRALHRLHRHLEGVDIPEPSDADLLEARRAVLRAVRAEAAKGEDSSAGRLGSFFVWTRPAVVAAAAAAVLLIGFAAGRMTFDMPGRAQESGPASLASWIDSAAVRSQGAVDATESPYSYSNVKLVEVDASTVRLKFDVTTALELVRSKDDPLVSEIVVQAMLQGELLDTRLDAIDAAVGIEPRVRLALIGSMLGDESLAVRLKSLTKLTTASAGDETTRTALLEVLEREESVQMRLLAIDHLTRHKVMPEALRAALSRGRPEPGNAVFVKAERYLETF